MNDKQQMFTERYQQNQTPWDTNITPPEIVAFVEEMPAGKALDLGCGTGTNVRYLAEHGWQADGIDFVPQAIDMAREKLADFDPQTVNVAAHDVTQLDTCDILRPPYDLIVDIGCGHGIPKDQQPAYAKAIADRLKMGGYLMLYSHFPVDGRENFGWSGEDVHRLFLPHLTLVWEIFSIDTTNGSQSGWYRLQKTS